ncbi:MAG: fructosamine kinase family protein [Gammaproteobacteria bacterium]|nr:fructosamine kinase family protein [Gammaproteobacteria bacterium]
MSQLSHIVQDIEKATALTLSNYHLSPIAGGCINTAYRLETQQHSFFIKLNQPRLLPMFEAEARGLQEMAELAAVRIPKVICYGQADNHSYLVQEYISLGNLRGQANQLLGKQLAQLHQHQQPYFGWHIDNTIGSTPQHNDREHDWLTFWQQHRLGAQLEFAAKNGFGGRLQEKGQRLMSELNAFFDNYSPTPSLLHGDLWGGNAAADSQGNPIIFDPACYYGDRETDVAMTELFGGFGGEFYSAYQSEYPLDTGYKTRKTLYNLYHILNHVNLFGGGYLAQAESMIEQCLAEI